MLETNNGVQSKTKIVFLRLYCHTKIGVIILPLPAFVFCILSWMTDISVRFGAQSPIYKTLKSLVKDEYHTVGLKNDHTSQCMLA